MLLDLYPDFVRAPSAAAPASGAGGLPPGFVAERANDELVLLELNRRRQDEEALLLALTLTD